ncbi:hypothetical protein [Martelella mediterranea]|uniref:hypothetical protein n=1 Tax=Martelella mediterranea TaxID=293089 RepID=UPI00104701A9|nr:hypothetical protein [Martelella mediterranea]
MNTLAGTFASDAFRRCPVCGAAEDMVVGSVDEHRHARAYLCSAVFERIEGFFACTHPCPAPSQIAVSHIIAEAQKGSDHE